MLADLCLHRTRSDIDEQGRHVEQDCNACVGRALHRDPCAPRSARHRISGYFRADRPLVYPTRRHCANSSNTLADAWRAGSDIVENYRHRAGRAQRSRIISRCRLARRGHRLGIRQTPASMDAGLTRRQSLFGQVRSLATLMRVHLVGNGVLEFRSKTRTLRIPLSRQASGLIDSAMDAEGLCAAAYAV